ncbi:MAG: peptidylprolyl isomerase [Desulfuromonadales bacterium]
MRVFLCLLLLLLPVTASASQYAVIETSKGNIKLELNEQLAPISVKNFLHYADAGFYDGTIFHRVIADFMIQGGGFDEALEEKNPGSAIRNEAGNGLKNQRGTIAMARTQVVDSATSQFFINLKDNAFLDHRGDSPRDFGYAVFGRVVEGMDVVDSIGKLKTVRKRGPFQDLPAETVIIRKIRRAEK